MSGTVEDVSDANYEEFMRAPAAVVAYGIASCEPCKEYDPILEETASRYAEVRDQGSPQVPDLADQP